MNSTLDTPLIDAQIKFIEQRIEIWRGKTALHESMREMYQGILASLIELKEGYQEIYGD